MARIREDKNKGMKERNTEGKKIMQQSVIIQVWEREKTNKKNIIMDVIGKHTRKY